MILINFLKPFNFFTFKGRLYLCDNIGNYETNFGMLELNKKPPINDKKLRSRVESFGDLPIKGSHPLLLLSPARKD